MTPPSRPTRGDLRDAVLETMDQINKDNAETKAAFDKPVPPRRNKSIALALLAVLNVVGWIIIPPPPTDSSDQRTPAAIESDLRLTIANAAVAVDAWRDSTGRLPRSLAEAGIGEAPVEFARLDSARYEVRGSDGALALTFQSGTAIADFLAARQP